VMPSLACDGVAKATLVVVQCHCRVMLMMVLPSLAGDGASEAMLAVSRCPC
jgi:hypothetical protein